MSERDGYEPGVPCWVDTWQPDGAAAGAFYAELLGCPLRVTVGKRGVEAGELEAQVRRGQEKRALPLDGAAGAVLELWRSLP